VRERRGAHDVLGARTALAELGEQPKRLARWRTALLLQDLLCLPQLRLELGDRLELGLERRVAPKRCPQLELPPRIR
jgi:hypothetical protein